ncbi:MAG: ABC transporter ATP-binding protein [Desulfobacterota bacterium]|nr:ABC transporter ATP-binding protein [Thermodesulfobacteriota bacterium]
MSESAIRIIDLKKSFDGRKVLDGINLEIERGKITVIIGKSGSGKTVLLKHIIGLIKPDGGEIWVDGVDITKLKEKELNKVRLRFGMLFQEAALFDSMTVWENVAFPLVERTKLKRDEIKRIVDEKLEQVGLLEHADKLPSEISGGMKKRAGLARALVLDPPIVLFDEPTSALDPIMAHTICDLIRDTQRKLKKTYVIISHDIIGMFRIADRVAMLNEGKIVAYGTPKDIELSKDAEIAEFLEASRIKDIGGQNEKR